MDRPRELGQGRQAAHRDTSAAFGKGDAVPRGAAPLPDIGEAQPDLPEGAIVGDVRDAELGPVVVPSSALGVFSDMTKSRRP